MKKNQPGVVLRFQAKKGEGDALFSFVTDLHYTGDPDGPTDWMLSRDDENPDVMWAFEFYRDQESFDRHYSDPSLDEPHQRIFEMLESQEGLDSSIRVGVHIVSSS